jgi:hypothetical protein
MTLGEATLEHEVLGLFDQQAVMLLERMVHARPRAIAAFAHTLVGSARGIGAWKVAQAAEAVEKMAALGGSPGLSGAIERLAGVIAEARAAIAGRRPAERRP